MPAQMLHGVDRETSMFRADVKSFIKKRRSTWWLSVQLNCYVWKANLLKPNWLILVSTFCLTLHIMTSVSMKLVNMRIEWGGVELRVIVRVTCYEKKLKWMLTHLGPLNKMTWRRFPAMIAFSWNCKPFSHMRSSRLKGPKINAQSEENKANKTALKIYQSGFHMCIYQAQHDFGKQHFFIYQLPAVQLKCHDRGGQISPWNCGSKSIFLGRKKMLIPF